MLGDETGERGRGKDTRVWDRRTAGRSRGLRLRATHRPGGGVSRPSDPAGAARQTRRTVMPSGSVAR